MVLLPILILVLSGINQVYQILYVVLIMFLVFFPILKLDP